MAAPSLTWYELTDLLPELESIRLAAAGTRINAEHPRWCRSLAWPHFHMQIKAMVGPECGSKDRNLLRWSSLDVARLVVFLALPPCPRGCEHKIGVRHRAEIREPQEVGA